MLKCFLSHKWVVQYKYKYIDFNSKVVNSNVKHALVFKAIVYHVGVIEA